MSGGETMDGILIIDKPIGMTSHDVVYKVRKILHEKSIGHTGTLDPLASGVMVLCIGSATKLVKYFTEHDKTYEVGIDIGYATKTDDLEGEVTEVVACDSLSEANADEVLASFVGLSMQIPPDYSAIKIDGKKLYEYARKNQQMPEISSRTVLIYDLKRTSPISINNGVAHFSFFVHCGKGMYVRALCRDLGKRLGCAATMTNLRRSRVGDFTLNDAQPLHLVQLGTSMLRDPLPYLHMPSVLVDEPTRIKIKNGVFLSMMLFPDEQDSILVDAMKTPLAIYTYDESIKMMRLSVLFQ
jgi:tRNA pseudouridine55 synthase